jgi:hypothetical protein
MLKPAFCGMAPDSPASGSGGRQIAFVIDACRASSAIALQGGKSQASTDN